MSEQTFTGTLYDDPETLKRFRDFENRYYQAVTILSGANFPWSAQ